MSQGKSTLSISVLISGDIHGGLERPNCHRAVERREAGRRRGAGRPRGRLHFAGDAYVARVLDNAAVAAPLRLGRGRGQGPGPVPGAVGRPEELAAADEEGRANAKLLLWSVSQPEVEGWRERGGGCGGGGCPGNEQEAEDGDGTGTQVDAAAYLRGRARPRPAEASGQWQRRRWPRVCACALTREAGSGYRRQRPNKGHRINAVTHFS